jgi:hypothetical protein
MTMIAACRAAYKNTVYQDDQISDIVACLADWVHETENAHGWSFDDDQLHWIGQMIARGMIAQHRYTRGTLTDEGGVK